MPEHRDFAYIRSFGSLLLSFRIIIKKINIQRTLCWVDKLNFARKTSVVPLESESLNFKGRPICNNQCVLQYKFVRENPRGIFADSKYKQKREEFKKRVNLTLLYVSIGISTFLPSYIEATLSGTLLMLNFIVHTRQELFKM